MKKMLVHFAKDRNSGEFRRIARLSNDSDKILNSTTYEVVFLPITYCGKLTSLKQNKLGKKLFLFPILLPLTRFTLIVTINQLLSSFLVLLISNVIRPDIIWGETLPGNLALLNLNIFHIADFHGAAPEETFFIRKNTKHFKRSSQKEENIIKKANIIIVQSNAMKSHLIKKHNIVNKDKIIVYNCGVNTSLFDYNKVNIDNLRSKLGFNRSDIIITYAGGTHKWQMLYPTLDIMKKVIDILPNVKCQIILQGDKQPFIDYCRTNNIKNITFFQEIPFCEMFKYISISDYALLLRENILLNQVASPTKLGEYLSCGQTIITTNVVEYWEWLNTDDIIKIDPKDTNLSSQIIVESIRNKEKINKKRMRDLAINNLSSTKDYESLKQIFKCIQDYNG